MDCLEQNPRSTPTGTAVIVRTAVEIRIHLREIKPEFERMAPGSVGEAFLYLIAFFIQDYPQLDIERSL